MKSFILGTDWWTDCDDAVAIRLISRAVKSGDARLLGVCINACMPYSVASLKGFLEIEGLHDIPVGIDNNATDFGGKLPYQEFLASLMPDVKNEDAMDAVRLYRKLLAMADEKVEIIEIGFLQVFSALLSSGADDISEKSGIDLVKEKVSKIWVMAGKWDADGEKENNFCRNARSRVGGKEFCEKCPVPVTFLGWEVGYGVLTGGELAEGDLLHKVLELHGSSSGRHSWDPMTVMLALIGDEEKAGYDTVVGAATVDSETGANYFKRSSNGMHKFVIKKFDDRYYEDQINAIIRSV